MKGITIQFNTTLKSNLKQNFILCLSDFAIIQDVLQIL